MGERISAQKVRAVAFSQASRLFRNACGSHPFHLRQRHLAEHLEARRLLSGSISLYTGGTPLEGNNFALYGSFASAGPQGGDWSINFGDGYTAVLSSPW